MKKFLVLFPLFLFLVALDAYLISDFISTQNAPAPAVKGISTEADQNVIELEIKNDENEGERIKTSPTPIPVEIIDKRGASAANIEDEVKPTLTNTPEPTNSPTPTPSPTPSPIRITVPPVIT
jgi:hypothetical protein